MGISMIYSWGVEGKDPSLSAVSTRCIMGVKFNERQRVHWILLKYSFLLSFVWLILDSQVEGLMSNSIQVIADGVQNQMFPVSI